MADEEIVAQEALASTNRRSHRLLLHMPLRIRGLDLHRKLFIEETETLVVNAHGGLVALAAIVRVGTELLLLNIATNRQQEAKVVFLGSMKSGKREVGFEFENPAGNFWGMAFPPADWTPANRAAPEP